MKHSSEKLTCVVVCFFLFNNLLFSNEPDTSVNKKKQQYFTISSAILFWSPAKYSTPNKNADKLVFSSAAQPSWGIDFGYKFCFAKNWFMHSTMFLNREQVQYKMSFNANDFSSYFDNLPVNADRSIQYARIFSSFQAGIGFKVGHDFTIGMRSRLFVSSGILAFYSFVSQVQAFYYLPGFENNTAPTQGNIAAVFQYPDGRPARFGWPYMLPFSGGYSIKVNKIVYSLQLEYNRQLRPLNIASNGIIFLPNTPDDTKINIELPMHNFGLRFQIGF